MKPKPPWRPRTPDTSAPNAAATCFDTTMAIIRSQGPLTASAVLLLAAIHTLIWGVPVHLLGLLKILGRGAVWRQRCTRAAIAVVRLWIQGILLLLDSFCRVEWDIRVPKTLRPQLSYVVLSNHRSWADILALLQALSRRIPFFRIFAKREILWLPVIGTSLLTLDYPIMRRHSRDAQLRDPAKRGRDLETARRMCRRYRGVPVSILIFAEGTRFTPAKRRRQKSPHRHLLIPKTGGLALAVGAMEGRIRQVIDVTVAYSTSDPRLWDLLCGRIRRITVHGRLLDIPAELLDGALTDDEGHRAFRSWIDAVWGAKDRALEDLMRPGPVVG